MIEAVGICNATCNYCPQGAGKVSIVNNQEFFISPKILHKSLFLAKKGSQKAIYLHHRGEPLLHPNIGYVISEVRKANFLAYLSTNLIAATDDKINEIFVSGINQVEIHLSGGLTKLTINQLLERIQKIIVANRIIRNSSCKIEVNYALQGDENELVVRKNLSQSKYYNKDMYIRFYKPHNWVDLMEINDYNINPKDCEWYKNNSCAILCNGDIVICCLDQISHSKVANVLDIDEISPQFLFKREICRGCIQHNWDMDWLRQDSLSIPEEISENLKKDPWRANYGHNYSNKS